MESQLLQYHLMLHATSSMNHCDAKINFQTPLDPPISALGPDM